MRSGAALISGNDNSAGEQPGRVIVFTLLILALGMTLVWIFTIVTGDHESGSGFAFGTISCIFFAAAAEVLSKGRFNRVKRSGLALVLTFYVIGPAIAAIPLLGLRSVADFDSAYFEMASALTTTGATIFWNLEDVQQAVILWRAMLSGFGGFVCLVSALAILAPLSIGGFEVDHMIDRRATTINYAFLCASEGARSRGLEARIIWASRIVLIPYLGMMALCTFFLAASGLNPFEAFCFALASVSTTGFAPTASGVAGYNAFMTEFILLLVIIPAAIGITAHMAARRSGIGSYLRNPELHYMAIAVFAVVAILFLRNWFGALETRSTDEIKQAFTALWGAFFMSVSFITTTGFESAAWEGATTWSGLETPGIVLLGLAITGGGAASTAGGIKLLRAALLAKHSMAELRRLARPASMQPIFSGGRVVTFDALSIVWIFVMLYLITVAVCALGLAASGLRFVDAFAASVAAISNTGPLLEIIAGEGRGYATHGTVARYILCAAMIVGRMETLAVIALCSVSAWRR